MNRSLFRNSVCGDRVNNAGGFLNPFSSCRYTHTGTHTVKQNNNVSHTLKTEPAPPQQTAAELGPTAASQPAPTGAGEISLESSVLSSATESDEKKIREDTIASLVALLDGKNLDVYSFEEYASDIRKVLHRGELVAPSDVDITNFAEWGLIDGRASRSIKFSSWVGTMPLAKKNPIAVIRNAAKKVSGCYVFMSGAFGSSFFSRVVGTVPQYLPSPTTDAIIANGNEVTSHLIGGASGSGKTMSLVGFGNPRDQQIVFPVLFHPRDFDETLLVRMEGPDGRLSKDMEYLEPTERNAKFLGALVALVERVLPGRVLSVLRNPTDVQVTIVLAMDEAGMSPQMVLAMASLRASDVSNTLGFGKHVSLRLVACGTGVGGGKQIWGSEIATFTAHYIDESHQEVNEKIFLSMFPRSSDKRALPFDVDPIMSFVRSNGRMAAVLGHLASLQIAYLHVSGSAFDLRMLLPAAAGMFRSLNGLRRVSPDEMASSLVLALRQHLFPFLPVGAITRARIQTRYGLITDVSRPHVMPEEVSAYTAKGFLPISASSSDRKDSTGGQLTDVELVFAPADGRYQLPLFATTMLANLSGMDTLAKSINTSESLGHHWLNASFLAACAAGSPELFELLLDEGRLRPLGEYVATSGCVANITSALLKGGISPDSVGKLKPVPKGVALQGLGGQMMTILCDLQAEGVCISCNTGGGKDSGSESPTVHSTYVSIIESRLKAAAEQTNTTAPTTRIAAFRNPAKFSFADSILFFNNTLYFFRLRDVKREKGEHNTCAWTEGAFMAEHTEMENGPLGELKAVWKATMNLDIKHVRYCLVSNCEHIFSEEFKKDGALLQKQKTCNFVVADAKTFIPFEPTMAKECARVFTLAEYL